MPDREPELASLLSLLNGMLYRCRNDAHWTVTWASDGCLLLTGYTATDLVDNPVVAFGDLVHPDDQEPLRSHRQKCLEAHQPSSYEYRIRTASGEEKWVWDQAQGVYAETGEVLFLEGYLRDITVRRWAETRLQDAEAALRKSERRFRALLEGSLDAISVLAPDGVPSYHSPAAGLITGYSIAELMTKNMLSLVHDDDRALADSMLQRLALDPAGTAQVSLRLVHKSGHDVWIDSEGQNLLADPDVAGIVVNFRDVTHRKAADRLLRESEERLRLALVGANQGIYDLNVQTGEAHVSPEYATMLGYDAVDFHETNAAWLDRLHPKDHAITAKAYADYTAGKTSEYRVEFRQRAKSGEWKWILSLGKIVQRTADGRPLRMLGSHTDITDRKLAEENLRRSERYRRTIFDAEPECVKVVSRDGLLLDMNRAGLDMLEIAALAEVQNKPLLEFLVPTYRSAFADLHRRVMAGATAQLEFEIEGRRGSRRWMATHAVPLRDNNEQIYAVLAISHDITNHRRAEAEREKLQAQLLQARKMESIGRLAGGVAHDFNNMLAVILGRAEIALASSSASAPLSDELHEDLQEIVLAARRSADLTRQLLAFSRRQTVAPRVIDLNATIDEVLQMLARLIGEQIELSWQPGTDVWPVHVDPTQIGQVLANLVINARDAIGGTGAITIQTHNAERRELPDLAAAELQDGDYIALSVSDNGRGMTKEVLDHLFEPFFTTKGVGQGTGLGLATVWGIVRQNGGFIDVTSTPDAGTMFRILLPRAATDTIESIATPPMEAVRGNGETILFVEDERAILELGHSMLVGLGYDVMRAESPAEALRLADAPTKKIDLLITDVVMPGMNGVELQKRLRARMPALKCLFMSGYPADFISEGGALRPGVLLLQKPFVRAELATRIREALAAEVPRP